MEERICDLETDHLGVSTLEKQKEKRIRKTEQDLRYFRDSKKPTNICIMGIIEGERKEKGTKGILEEIMAENFPDVMKNIHLHSQDAP